RARRRAGGRAGVPVGSRAARDDPAPGSRGASGGGRGGDADDRGLAGREVRSVPIAADVAGRERGAPSVPGDAGAALGIIDCSRSRCGCAMKMSKDRVLLIILVPVLLVVGALALRGRPAGEPANAASPPPPAPAKPLALSAAAQARTPVKVAPAELAKLAGDIQVVGTVAFHEDHYAVVGPLVPGRMTRMSAGVGDKVKRGQVIAEIESSAVGQARAELVSAKARFAAADANLKRENDLAEKKISSVREKELARAQWETEQAGVRAAIMRLRAIGLSQSDIDEATKHDLGGRVA